MRTILFLVLLTLALASACNGDDLSIGERRCAGTTCSPLDSPLTPLQAPEAGPQNRTALAEKDLEVLPERTARLVWTSAEQLSCPQDDCERFSLASATRLLWGLHADGAISLAEMFIVDDPMKGNSAVVRVTHLGSDGGVLWARDVVTVPRPDRSAMLGGIALGIAPDGSILLAIGAFEEGGALTLRRVSAQDGESVEPNAVVQLRNGTQPEAIAWAGDDLLVAGFSPGATDEYSGLGIDLRLNPELSRYGSDGALIWRQAVLMPHSAFQYGPSAVPLLGFPPQMRVTSDAEARAVVSVLAANGLVETHLRADGTVAWYDIRARQTAAQAQTDADGRFVVGSADDDAYHISRCDVPDCSSRVEVERSRQSYFDPGLYGLAIDDASRIYVLTQDGDRAHHRTLLDRYSRDMRQRETFVVTDPPGQPFVFWSDIALGPDGDVYCAGSEHVARIHLD